MTEKENGRIKLSWAQIVWAIGMIATVIGAWGDGRVRDARTLAELALIRQELGLRLQDNSVEHARIWKAIEEAQAAPVKQQGR